MQQRLPEEALEGVASHLGYQALKKLSLTCRDLHRIVLPDLFGVLDLGKRDPAELEQLHSDLFDSTDDSQKSLGNMHIKRVQVQMIEELCEPVPRDEDGEPVLPADTGTGETEAELVQRQKWVDRCLDAIKSIGTLQVELCLMGLDDNTLFDDVFLPALATTVQRVSSKIDKVELAIDSFGLCTHNEEGKVRTSAKLAGILAVFPPTKLAVVYLNGLHLAPSAPGGIDAMRSHLTSSNLTKLTMRDISGDFANWRPVALRHLTASWTSPSSTDTSADFRTAFQIMELSAFTLASLRLENLGGVDYSGIHLTSRAFALPEMRKCGIVDGSVGAGSVLDALLEWTTMPILVDLDLESDDIAHDLSHMLEKVPCLSRLSLSQGRHYLHSGQTPTEIGKGSDGYDKTVAACAKAGISLVTNYSCQRCDSSIELEDQLQRIATIAEHLETLTLAVNSAAICGLASMAPIELPALRRLSIGITDSASVMPADHAADSEEPIASSTSYARFLGSLDAPRLNSLEATFFVQQAHDPFVRELHDLLAAGQHPHLEALEGAIVAGFSASTDELVKEMQNLHDICRERGVDTAGLRFISRSELVCAHHHHHHDEHDHELEDGDSESPEGADLDDEDAWTDEDDEQQLEDDDAWTDEDSDVELDEEAEIGEIGEDDFEYGACTCGHEQAYLEELVETPTAESHLTADTDEGCSDTHSVHSDGKSACSVADSSGSWYTDLE